MHLRVSWHISALLRIRNVTVYVSEQGAEWFKASDVVVSNKQTNKTLITEKD